MRKAVRKHSKPPAERFPLWFGFGIGWTVRLRPAADSHPHFLRLYVARGAPGFGRYWLTWSTTLDRFVAGSELDRLTRRYPDERLELEQEIRRHAR